MLLESNRGACCCVHALQLVMIRKPQKVGWKFSCAFFPFASTRTTNLQLSAWIYRFVLDGVFYMRLLLFYDIYFQPIFENWLSNKQINPPFIMGKIVWNRVNNRNEKKKLVATKELDWVARGGECLRRRWWWLLTDSTYGFTHNEPLSRLEPWSCCHANIELTFLGFCSPSSTSVRKLTTLAAGLDSFPTNLDRF